jgi:hypothetical protein
MGSARGSHPPKISTENRTRNAMSQPPKVVILHPPNRGRPTPPRGSIRCPPDPSGAWPQRRTKRTARPRPRKHAPCAAHAISTHDRPNDGINPSNARSNTATTAHHSHRQSPSGAPATVAIAGREAS